MDPIDLFPVVDKQTNFYSLLFVGKFVWNFPLFLSEIKELVILPFVGIPNSSEFCIMTRVRLKTPT